MGVERLAGFKQDIIIHQSGGVLPEIVPPLEAITPDQAGTGFLNPFRPCEGQVRKPELSQQLRMLE
jgi:hypothetical protein